MKAAAFAYSKPASLDEACALLAADDGARVIAGGQTLVPLMAMRLARPTRLVDIARVPDLAFVREEEEGAVVIGATTTQRAAEAHPLVRQKLPLLAHALPWVGHAATRARGTVGGSLANADPAAEIGLVAVTLDATVSYRNLAKPAKLLTFLNRAKMVEMKATDFFVGPMTTAMPAAGLLTAVRFPIWPERVGVGFQEISSRKSDFAFAAAAAQVTLNPDGTCARLAVGVGGATETPIRLDAVAGALQGTRPTPDAVRTAVTNALTDVTTIADLHASADYRRRAAVSLAIRAITEACGNAGHVH